MRQRSSAHRRGVLWSRAIGGGLAGRRLAHMGFAVVLLLPALALLALGVPAVRAATGGPGGHGALPLIPADTPSASPSLTPSPSPTLTPSPSPTATPTPKPSPTATATARPSPTATATLAPTATVGATPTTTPGQTNGGGGNQNSGLIVALVIALGLVLLGLAALVMLIGTRRPPAAPAEGAGYQGPIYTPPENYDPNRPSVYPGQGGGVSEIGPDDPTDPGLGTPPRR